MPFLVLDPTAAQAAPGVIFGAPEDATKHPAGKTLAAMRTRMRLELGNRGTSDLPDVNVTEWINDAYQDIYASLDLPESKASFQINTAAAQPLYLLPPSVSTIRSISGENTTTATDEGAAFQEIDSSYYRKLPVQSGPPVRWFRDNMMLVLWPTPDDVYALSIDIRIKPLPLVADGDYAALEDKWHEVLYKAAKYRAWEALQQDAKSLVTMNEMTRLIQRKNDRDADDKAEAYPSMRPVMRERDITRLGRHSRRFHEDEF